MSKNKVNREQKKAPAETGKKSQSDYQAGKSSASGSAIIQTVKKK